MNYRLVIAIALGVLMSGLILGLRTLQNGKTPDRDPGALSPSEPASEVARENSGNTRSPIRSKGDGKDWKRAQLTREEVMEWLVLPEDEWKAAMMEKLEGFPAKRHQEFTARLREFRARSTEGLGPGDEGFDARIDSLLDCFYYGYKERKESQNETSPQ